MSVHSGGSRQKSSLTTLIIVSSLLKRQLSRKVYPIHRLDHRTSGALVFAFTSSMASILNEVIHNNYNKQKTIHNSTDHYNETSMLSEEYPSSSKKTYVALLRGNWDHFYGNESSVTIDSPIVAYDDKDNQVLKSSQTIFKRLAVVAVASTNITVDDNQTLGIMEQQQEQQYDERYYTFVLIQPITGRTHQIRRHAASIMKMPIIGDTEHGDTKINRHFRQSYNINCLLLHCLAISFDLPKLGSNTTTTIRHIDDNVSNYVIDNNSDDITYSSECVMECIDIIAPLPDDIKNVLKSNFSILWYEAIQIEPRLSTNWIDSRSGTKGTLKAWQKEKNLYGTTAQKMIQPHTMNLKLYNRY